MIWLCRCVDDEYSKSEVINNFYYLVTICLQDGVAHSSCIGIIDSEHIRLGRRKMCKQNERRSKGMEMHERESMKKKETHCK